MSQRLQDLNKNIYFVDFVKTARYSNAECFLFYFVKLSEVNGFHPLKSKHQKVLSFYGGA